jgi:AmiR/NasT family two-component response regulator
MSNVLILCRDLFFSSQLQGAAQRAGGQPRLALSQTQVLSILNEGPADAVIVDLETPNLDLPALRAALPSPGRLLAFGPHVRAELLESAAQAGCDAVLTRGQAAAALEEVLRRVIRTERD